jgi:hypothetical protein
MPTREEMNSALQRLVVPVLRKRGFTGSLPHLRRVANDRIDLLTFQFDKWGGGFVVEVAKSDADGVTMSWGETIPPARIKAHDVHPKMRLRLGAAGPGEDHWFRYDTGDTVEAVAQEVVARLAQAEAWWGRTDVSDAG